MRGNCSDFGVNLNLLIREIRLFVLFVIGFII